MMREAATILIIGPTAGGKTRLAVELAQRLEPGGECVCADSMQVYRGMDIGTAKPTMAERAGVPHHLIDVADPADDGFTVDTWLRLAEQAIDGIRARGRHPIVVGGTNLYVQAMLQGMSGGPEPDPALRMRLEGTSLDELRVWLERVDPAAAGRIHPNDRKRTIRAIEVHELTGSRMSDRQVEWRPTGTRDDFRIVGLDWPVEAINRRINERVRTMMADGLLDEVRRLQEGGGLGRQAAAALGYRQIIDHLEGRTTLEEAVEQIKIRTRRFGKHQRTWIQRFRVHPDSLWLPAGELEPQELVDKAVGWLSAGPEK